MRGGAASGVDVPHLIIEYSANLDGPLDIAALVDDVHAAALAHGLPSLDALRTRAVARDHYRIADGNPTHGFIALLARIGPGRSAEQKTSFLQVLMDTLEAAVAPIGPDHAVALSVEIQEIDPELRINRNHVRTRMQENPPT